MGFTEKRIMQKPEKEQRNRPKINEEQKIMGAKVKEQRVAGGRKRTDKSLDQKKKEVYNTITKEYPSRPLLSSHRLRDIFDKIEQTIQEQKAI